MEYTADVAYFNIYKHGQFVAGDTFLLNKTQDGRKVVSLADGLGSGVKANVLSQLTASMAQKFITSGMDMIKTAQSIMDTLPVCSVRNVSYSTLTSLDILENGSLKVLEYDNPDLLWLRNGSFLKFKKKLFKINTEHKRQELYLSEIQLQPEDRLIIFSDGVTQSGMGSKNFPLGWGIDNVKKFIVNIISATPNISSQKLSRMVVNEAIKNDRNMPKDDITCSVVNYRRIKNTLLLTGPPFEREKCHMLVEKFKTFQGCKIISGGTTSNIIAEGIGETLSVDMSDMGEGIPPRAIMKGADLVTEGMLTINKVISILNNEDTRKLEDKNAAYKMVQLLLESDKIYFLLEQQ